MKLLKLLDNYIYYISWVGFGQNKVRVKLKINLIPVEQRNGHLKNCQVKIFRNSVGAKLYNRKK